MIKIVGGTYRSRVLLTPGPQTIPTKSVVRTGIMNALGDKIPGAVALDLFAGSGALGIECLSRGAREAYFVDSSVSSAEIIKQNLENLKIPAKNVYVGDFKSCIEQFAVPFDIVFLDPPYAKKGYYDEALSLLDGRGLLKGRAVIVLEYEGEPPSVQLAYTRLREYKYGRTRVIIMWR